MALVDLVSQNDCGKGGVKQKYDSGCWHSSKTRGEFCQDEYQAPRQQSLQSREEFAAHKSRAVTTWNIG